MGITENNYSMDNFSDRVLRRLKDYYGEEYSVEIQDVKRNNDCVKRAVIIRGKNEKTVPTIYLEDFYRRYTEGETLFNIVSELIEVRKMHAVEWDIDVEFMMDYEQVRNRLGIKLLNKAKNMELIHSAPYMEFADMILIFMVIMEDENIGRGAITIKNEMFEKWGVTKEVLCVDARNNMMRKFPPKNTDIIDLLIDMYREKYDDGTEFAKEEMEYHLREMESLRREDSSLYVITNKERWYGASVITYPDLLEEIGVSLGRDYIILPSSVHEVILVPCNEGVQYNNLSDMVRAVNENAVEAEEVLSDHAYKYHRANHWLESLD